MIKKLPKNISNPPKNWIVEIRNNETNRLLFKNIYKHWRIIKKYRIHNLNYVNSWYNILKISYDNNLYSILKIWIWRTPID